MNKKKSTEKGYRYKGSTARIEEDASWIQLIPAILFTACVIMVVRAVTYQRPMEQFFWSGSGIGLIDFFSYGKMVFLIICTLAAGCLLLFRQLMQTLSIKRSFAYIPMAIYAGFVILSYIFSDYKVFALLGWNERFEGTIPLICYMVLLFYILNTVNTERDAKRMIYSVAVTSAVLGMLGITQALGHNFFGSEFGKKLITPSQYWNQLDNLTVATQVTQITQTVYNSNYVSFYLTLLVPLFGLVFIKSVMDGKIESMRVKIMWGALFALLIFNLFGSESSGGILGVAASVLLAFIVLNKRLIEWWKPVMILFAISIAVAGICYDSIYSEIGSSFGNVTSAGKSGTAESSGQRHKIDYIETSDKEINFSSDGRKLAFIQSTEGLLAKDEGGELLNIVPSEDQNIGKIDDARFDDIKLKLFHDNDKIYFVLITEGTEWPFLLTENGPKFVSGTGNPVELHKISAIGWSNNQTFGSGRGYIWSRTIPLMKETVILGHGADTFPAYFPQDDYAGKYNMGLYSSDLRSVVIDKPHNMYLGIVVGTGGISLAALLVLWGFYLMQSFILYRKIKYTDFLSYSGAGIFLGISGFLISGLVNDSSVSVMPLFYGLLGTGMAVNLMVWRKFTIHSETLKKKF